MSKIFHKDKPTIPKSMVERPKGSKPQNNNTMNPKDAFNEMSKADNALRENKGWNVLSYVTKFGIKVCKNGFGKWVDSNKCEYNEQSLMEGNCYYEVYRHRDSQYFKIGDEVIGKGAHSFVIEKFVNTSQGLLAVSTFLSSFLHNIEKVKPKKDDYHHPDCPALDGFGCRCDALDESDEIEQEKYFNKKLKGMDSFLVVGGHIPSAFYNSLTQDIIWTFNQEEQAYQYRRMFVRDLHDFESSYPKLMPLYNDKQIEAAKNS